jgi:hypothetical protein
MDGQERLIPSLVPSLNKAEIDILLNIKKGQQIPSQIVDKAAQHAMKRIKAGKSPFFD